MEDQKKHQERKGRAKERHLLSECYQRRRMKENVVVERNRYTVLRSRYSLRTLFFFGPGDRVPDDRFRLNYLSTARNEEQVMTQIYLWSRLTVHGRREHTFFSRLSFFLVSRSSFWARSILSDFYSLFEGKALSGVHLSLRTPCAYLNYVGTSECSTTDVGPLGWVSQWTKDSRKGTRGYSG